jgi:hydroxymethylglutaryl-CoA reductase (NADPH)
MGSSTDKSKKALELISTTVDIQDLVKRIKNKKNDIPEREALPITETLTIEGRAKRLAYLKKEANASLEFLTGEKQFSDFQEMKGNIENFIGMSQVPTGVIGPVRVIGTAADGDFFVPLATSEGALVASYHRGAKAARMSGGITSVCTMEGVQRSPVFKFEDMSDAAMFLVWVLKQVDEFKRITSECSRYAKLIEMRTNIEGNNYILTFEYHTGDAAGQNMVTLCTDEICKYIITNSPVKPTYYFIESNYSGDKKATAISFTNVRGKKVTSEVVIPQEIVENILKTSPKAMVEYWKASTLGVIQSGAIGAQGHFANGLTALFIATGQDAACVAEAAVGITRMELTEDGSLYASVTLPNLIVGTVGGGTGLPTQRECLELIDCYGEGKARKFAEICAAVVLSGELSIAAAISAGHFAKAHKIFGRKK